MSTQVLIVEDEESLRVIYRHVLSKLDCIIYEAASSQHALDILEQTSPHVILLDMMLPGVNGDAIIDYVVNTPRLQQTRILIISSNKNYQRYAQMYQQVTFVIKPIRPSDIRDFVEAQYV